MAGRKRKKDYKKIEEKRSVFLTSLNTTKDRSLHRYFMYDDDSCHSFCDAICAAEAGAKYILSRTKIDEVIVIGPDYFIGDRGQENAMKLEEWDDFASTDPKDMTEYQLFCYRMVEHLDGLDMEEQDLLESIPLERQKELGGQYRDYVQEHGLIKEKIFEELAMNPGRYQEVVDRSDNMTPEEWKWLKHQMFLSLKKEMRMPILSASRKLTIRFVPINSGMSERNIRLDNIRPIIDAVVAEAKNVDLYLDMQGMAAADGYTLLSVLSMMNDDSNNPVTIQEIITTHDSPDHFISRIDNKEMQRYSLNELAAGLTAFLQYGKVDIIRNWWFRKNIQNERIDQLLYAMQYVDEGISLCNVSDIEKGIRMLRHIFQSQPEGNLPELESNILALMEKSILMDYGALLEGGEMHPVDLVRWAFRKKFYQQAITIIESRVPAQLIRMGILYYAEGPEEKERWLKELSRFYWHASPKDRWKLMDPDHYYVKFYRPAPTPDTSWENYLIMRKEEIADKVSVKKRPCGHTLIPDHMEELGDLLMAYYKIGDVRNNINHAVKPNQAEDEEVIDVYAQNETMELLITSVENFLDCYDKVEKLLPKEKPDIQRITARELLDYSHEHSPIQKKKEMKENKENQEMKEESTSDKMESSGKIE